MISLDELRKLLEDDEFILTEQQLEDLRTILVYLAYICIQHHLQQREVHGE